jgi:hypothetical protein
MGLIKSEYACPTCQRATGAHNQILAADGRLICSVNSQHVWVDYMEFANLNPEMVFKVAPPPPAVQEHHTPYVVSIPTGAKDVLEARFGEDRLKATLAGILMQLVEGPVLLIGETDLERLGDAVRGLGHRPESSGELVGSIFSLRQEVADAKMSAETAAREVKAYEGLGAETVVINLGENYLKAAEKARAQDPPLPTKVWLERQIHNAMDQDWF